jgi:excisionase family DNA binding protein
MRTALQRHYTPREVAELLSLCTWTVRRLIRAREFPSVVNVGSEQRPDYRVPADEVSSYLARRRIFLEKAN